MKFLILLFSLSIFSQDYYYPPTDSDEWETVSLESLGWNTNEIPALYDYLDGNNTKAFLILKNGRIVIEQYFDGFTKDSAWYWASAGKTITATLAGIVQEQGLLDINEPSKNYLGDGWSSLSENQENKITIRHHLTMTTGLNDIGVDVDCTDPGCLEFLAEPGTRWAYHNAPYTLLGDIISNAADLTYNQFTFRNLHNKIGMTGAWFDQGYNNLFISKPRSMARFGIMIASGGRWENEDIISDKEYLNDMINSSQDINKSYGYLWWLNGKESYMVPRVQNVFEGPMNPNAPSDAYAAMGKNGQLLEIVPSQDLIVIRMGDAPDEDISFIATTLSIQIWEYLSKVIDEESNVEITNDLIKIKRDRIEFDRSLTGKNFKVHDLMGKEIKAGFVGSVLSFDSFKTGIYFLEIDDYRLKFIVG